MKTLDITGITQTGSDLKTMIEVAFQDTQRFIVQPYPSEILMRRDQYDDLMKQAGTLVQFMVGNEKDRLYRTKEGYVMELRIKE